MEWQPIETAPRDGSCIIVSTPTASSFSGMFVAYWCDAVCEWKYSRDAIVSGASHWMPLPEPPT